jgi:hypothetical protein
LNDLQEDFITYDDKSGIAVNGKPATLLCRRRVSTTCIRGDVTGKGFGNREAIDGYRQKIE